jgi:hypothetical protein
VLMFATEGLFGGKVDPFAEMIVGDGAVWKHVTPVKKSADSKAQWALNASQVVSVHDIQKGQFVLYAKDSSAKTANKVIGRAVISLSSVFSNLDEWVDLEGQLMAPDSHKSFGQFAIRVRYRISPLPADEEATEEESAEDRGVSEERDAGPEVAVAEGSSDDREGLLRVEEYTERPPSPEVVRYVHDLLESSVRVVEQEIEEKDEEEEESCAKKTSLLDEPDIKSVDITGPSLEKPDIHYNDPTPQQEKAKQVLPAEIAMVAPKESKPTSSPAPTSAPMPAATTTAAPLNAPLTEAVAPKQPASVAETGTAPGPRTSPSPHTPEPSPKPTAKPEPAEPDTDGFLEISNLNLTNLKNTGDIFAAALFPKCNDIIASLSLSHIYNGIRVKLFLITMFHTFSVINSWTVLDTRSICCLCCWRWYLVEARYRAAGEWRENGWMGAQHIWPNNTEGIKIWNVNIARQVKGEIDWTGTCGAGECDQKYGPVGRPARRAER